MNVFERLRYLDFPARKFASIIENTYKDRSLITAIERVVAEGERSSVTLYLLTSKSIDVATYTILEEHVIGQDYPMSITIESYPLNSLRKITKEYNSTSYDSIGNISLIKLELSESNVVIENKTNSDGFREYRSEDMKNFSDNVLNLIASKKEELTE